METHGLLNKTATCSALILPTEKAAVLKQEKVTRTKIR